MDKEFEIIHYCNNDRMSKEDWESYYSKYLKDLALLKNNGKSKYVDPDGTYNTGDREFYRSLVIFLNMQEKNFIEDKSKNWTKNWTYNLSKSGIEVRVNDEVKLVLRSDLFGFSAPNDLTTMSLCYPYGEYILGATYDEDKLSERCKNVANWIYETRVTSGTFLWPIYHLETTYPKSFYNMSRGVGGYIQDRVDLTLLEVKEFYQIYNKVNASKISFEEFMNDEKVNEASKISFEEFMNDEKVNASKISFEEFMNDEKVNEASKISFEEFMNDEKVNDSKISFEEFMEDEKVNEASKNLLLLTKSADNKFIYDWLTHFQSFENYVDFFCFQSFCSEVNGKYVPVSINDKPLTNSNITIASKVNMYCKSFPRFYGNTKIIEYKISSRADAIKDRRAYAIKDRRAYAIEEMMKKLTKRIVNRRDDMLKVMNKKNGE